MMIVLALLFFCGASCFLAEGLRLPPYVPAEWERVRFLQGVAGRSNAGLIGFVHLHNPGAWASAGSVLEDGTTALHVAAKAGNALAVRALLALGANVTARDARGRTPLHVTAEDDGLLLCTIELLDAGAEVDAVSGDGLTALMVATNESSPGNVAALLEAGADRTARLPGQQLSAATYTLWHSGIFTVAQILGATPVFSFPYRRYQCEDARQTEKDLPDLLVGKSSLNSSDSLGRTYIHKKSIPDEGDLFRSHDCIGDWRGRDVNVRDLFGRTPLHIAALWNNVDCVRNLLEQGANVGAADWLRRTPLHVAALCQHFDTQKLLREAGADDAAQDLRGRTPSDLRKL